MTNTVREIKADKARELARELGRRQADLLKAAVDYTHLQGPLNGAEDLRLNRVMQDAAVLYGHAWDTYTENVAQDLQAN